MFWIDGAAPGTLTWASIRLGGLAGADYTEWFERVPLVPAATEWAADNTGGYALSGEPDWDDATPGHTLTFGHCAQAWIPAFHPGVTAAHGGALPATSSVIPLGTLPGLGAITLPALSVPAPSVEPWADVAIQIVRTLQDNFGLVAWLCNTTDVTVSTS